MEPAGADDDWALLRRYAHERDEAAFTQVVRRHLNAVFSAATRRVGGDRHLAEDVTQAVFIILASKAKALCSRGSSGGAMSAWLLKCVRYAAANAIKMEARRQKRHDEFSRRQQHAGACSANPSDVLVWHEVAQQIDDAVLKLPAADREAVLLRYFEDRGIAEIAARMRTTEGAVKQRLGRAVERLRQRLSRRGAAAMLSTVDASAFAAMLASHLVTTAPPGLGSSAVAAAATAAASGVAGATLGTSIAKGAMTMMMWAKTKTIAAATIAAILVCGAGGIIAVKSASAADKSDAAPVAAAKDADEKKDAADAGDGNAVSLKNAPPVVVKTVPEAGKSGVDASIKEITVTYSKEMQNGSWSWSTWGEENFPKTTGKPHYKDDKRTCVLPVELKPGKTYAIWLNSENFGNFKDKSGHAAVPYLLIFETKK